MQDKKLDSIGSKIFVDFPDYGIRHVPAKVDTGAYTSSIWASNIREENGILTFVLFAPNSPFYTSKPISISSYQTKPVKNSSGQSEIRYFVFFRMRVEGKIIKARFNLANRSANTYPVLIGRRTLRGKFLVNVSQKHEKKRQKVIILNERGTNISPVVSMFNKIGKSLPNADLTLTHYQHLRFSINEDGAKIFLIKPDMDLAEFDLAYFKMAFRSRDIATVVAEYLMSRKIEVLNPGVIRHFTNNKLKQYMILGNSKIDVPESYFFFPEEMVKKYDFLSKKLGIPFVMKSTIGKKGRDNFLVKNEKEFKLALNSISDPDGDLLAQKYIPNDGDYRLVVMGSSVRLCIHRQAQTGGSHVNNTSAGAKATLVDKAKIPSHVRNMAVEAARLMELDVAGVDIVRDKKTGKWYCFEVNAGPQLATGAYVEEKKQEFAKYLKRKLIKIV